MLDPRRTVVLIIDRERGEVDERRSADVIGYAAGTATGTVDVVFKGSPKSYRYSARRVVVMHDPEQVALTGAAVEVDGQIWGSATDVRSFVGPLGRWCRVFYRSQNGERHVTLAAPRVRIVQDAARHPQTASILAYWRQVVSRLEDDDPLRHPYQHLGFVHPESALARYVAGAPIERREPGSAPIFPFRCNLSQREAVENGLTSAISVIEGPPGTGKTETILNLVANIITRSQTVAVVSFTNAAVDNVREKLDDLGFGHVVANLRAREKREEFFAGQDARNRQVTDFVRVAPPVPPHAGRMAEVDRRLRDAQAAERTRAELRAELGAYKLELRHFERFLERHEVPEPAAFPLLDRSSDRILDYLAETELVRGSPGLIRRIRNYLRYGSLRGLDPDDTNVVLRLQRAFYEQRVSELEDQAARVDDKLQRTDFDRLAEEHRELSTLTLQAALQQRYQTARKTYSAQTYRRGNQFRSFLDDYPVVLSTCHSLRAGVADGYLLDYVIIDEASQVDLLAATLAFSAGRNVVVVGDRRQLPHIARDAAEEVTSPHPGYDCHRHNILSSLTDLYGDHLPSALLREHYRCEPAIIGFCNKAFYDGDLIPFTTNRSERPMLVVRTAEGNHMRRHVGGGRSNQREIDAIVEEVIPEHCAAVPRTEIGVTAPYRLQVEKATGKLVDPIEAHTVHKFQGRQKQIVILTTVLDETWRGRTGLRFVDDPRLINVAVSRATERFILVANHDMLPRSRHIRDLVGYIRYHVPGEAVVDSAVVSVFDLLYREYSDRLRTLAARLRNEMTYRSEDIIWTVLQDIVAEDTYSHLVVSYQVLVRHLLVDLSGLTRRQEAFVRHRASIDFVVYNRVTNEPLLAIEVDGFAYHENDPAQLKRDAIKNEILDALRLPLLRLPTTGSGEDRRIREWLDRAEASRGERAGL